MASVQSPPETILPETILPHRQNLKVSGRTGADQARRRREALNRQKKARRDATEMLRKVQEAQADDPEEDQKDGKGDMAIIDDSGSPDAGGRRNFKVRDPLAHRRRAKVFYQQLCSPEWLVDVPSDLGCGEWFVMPRPDGKRCLVVTDQAGWAVARSHKDGRLIKRFRSPLPSDTILDCVFQAESGEFHILDAMCWRGYALYDCTAEFRLYWLRDKLSEFSYAPYPFVAVPYAMCDSTGLEGAYMTVFPFKKDGLLFIHKESHYTLGSTPLIIQWKDSRCSEYPVDSPDADAPEGQQTICLELTDELELLTSDEPPIQLGRVDAAYLEHINAKPGNLLKFAIGSVDQSAEAPSVTNMTFLRVVNRRLVADQWSRILYQYHARTQPITIEAIGSVLMSRGDMAESGGVGQANTNSMEC